MDTAIEDAQNLQKEIKKQTLIQKYLMKTKIIKYPT